MLFEWFIKICMIEWFKLCIIIVAYLRKNNITTRKYGVWSWSIYHAHLVENLAKYTTTTPSQNQVMCFFIVRMVILDIYFLFFNNGENFNQFSLAYFLSSLKEIHHCLHANMILLFIASCSLSTRKHRTLAFIPTITFLVKDELRNS